MIKKEQVKKEYITLNNIDVNAGIVSWYIKELTTLVNVMTKVYEDKILSLYKSNKEQIKEINKAEDRLVAFDEDSVGSQTRILLNKLNKIYSEYFDKKSKEKSATMISKIEKALKYSLQNSFYVLLSKLDKDNIENEPIRKLFSQFSPG